MLTSGSGFKKNVRGSAANKARRHLQLGLKYGGAAAIAGGSALGVAYGLKKRKNDREEREYQAKLDANLANWRAYEKRFYEKMREARSGNY